MKWSAKVNLLFTFVEVQRALSMGSDGLMGWMGLCAAVSVDGIGGGD